MVCLTKITRELFDEFDEAARSWGWIQDQGWGSIVDTAKTDYDRAKDALKQRLEQLERRAFRRKK